MEPKGRGPGLEWRIGRLAASQHGVVSVAQLVALGLGREAIKARARSGRLVRVQRGAYAVGRPALTFEARCMAACLTTGGAVSHQTAAMLHDLLPRRVGPIDITHPRCRTGRAIRPHRAPLDPRHVSIVGGITTTTIERALIDLADVVSPGTLRQAVHRAEVTNRLDVVTMHREFDAHPGRRTRHLRALLPQDTSKLRSEFERKVKRLLRRNGIGHFETNKMLRVDGAEYEIDLLWAHERVAVELDGYGAHRSRAAFVADRRRDRVLRLAGFTAMRFSYFEPPDEVVGHIRAALSASGLLEHPKADRSAGRGGDLRGSALDPDG